MTQHSTDWKENTDYLEAIAEFSSTDDDTKLQAFISTLLSEREKEIAVLQSDVVGAIGHMQGCGHEWVYLKRRYLDLLPEEESL